MLVSTFELLVKPIAPAGSGPAAVARTVVQGYFLTIANPSTTDLTLRVSFTATTPNLSPLNTVTIIDVNDDNQFGDVTSSGPNRSFTSVRIPAQDTVLVTLLPDIGNNQVLANPNLEVRGYVEISLAAPFSFSGFDLLLTPEHRGTFGSGNLADTNSEFDQLVYALPTATGSSLFKVRSTLFLPIPGSPLPTTPSGVSSAAPGLDDLEVMLNQMAQRLEGLENRLQTTNGASEPSAVRS
jgi:hypothetical protein